MNHEADFISAVNDGFRRWMNIEEIKTFIETERARVGKAPEIFLIGFNSKQGYIPFDASVVKMIKEVDEAGKLIDLELKVIDDNMTEPISLKASAFQSGADPHILFCRIFRSAKDRDNYYADIAYMTILSADYRLAAIEKMRRQLGF